MKEKVFKNMNAVYCMALFTIWTVLEIFLVPKMKLYMADETVDILKETVIKIIIWFIPSVFLIIHFNNFLYIKKDKLFECKSALLKYVPLFLIFAVYHIISDYVRNGSVSVSDSFRLSDILLSLTVGISEEMVFRGLFLNSILKENKNNWFAVSVNSIMFLLIHFPIWYTSGLFVEYIVSGSFVQIIILSLIFSWSFIKSKSIIVPIALHTFWDLLCWFL